MHFPDSRLANGRKTGRVNKEGRKGERKEEFEGKEEKDTERWREGRREGAIWKDGGR